jgi:hypothetical protein
MNRFLISLTRLSVLVPLISLAPAAHAQSALSSTNGVTNLGSWLLAIIAFIDVYVVPLVFALAFIIFIWGVFQYFIAGGASEEKRDEGKKFVMYGIIGFFLMFSVWGIVNLLVNTFHFNSAARPGLPTFGAPTTNSGGTTASPFGGTAVGGGSGATVGSGCHVSSDCGSNGTMECISGTCHPFGDIAAPSAQTSPTPPTEGDLNGLHP